MSTANRTELSSEGERTVRADAGVLPSDVSLPAQAATQGLVAKTLALFATHDLLLLGHLAIMGTLTLLAYPTEGSGDVGRRIASATVLLVGACLFSRGTKLPTIVRSGVYRLAAVATVLASYLMLRWTLPVVAPQSYDAQLSAIDVAVFGVEPTIWLEPRMTYGIVEYLAFFYFSYFIMCGLFALVSLGPTSSEETSAEFAVGTAVIYGIGQLGYAIVPGFGPVRHLADQYAGGLPGGYFWEAVLATVQAGSAMKDIFPSLHTAGPVWYALFAWRRASRTGSIWWKGLATVTTFFAMNIVVSTVVLRWHYVIDLVAGLTLATSAFLASKHAVGWERRLRDRLGLRSAWDFGS